MRTKKEKKIAFLTLVIILLNLFSPYSILLHRVSAASGTLPEPAVVFNKIQNITEKNGNKYFKVQIAVVGDINIKGLDIKLTYDETKIQPAVKTTGASNTNIALISDIYADMADGMYTIKTYDKTAKEYRIQYAKGGGHDLPELCYSPGMGWDALYADYDTWASGFDYYLPIITYTFRLVDTTLTDDDITTELFDIVPVEGSLPSGAQIVYEDASGVDIAYDITEISGVGFATPAKTVSGIVIKNNPTNTTYNHGETVDLAGGMITVTYSDGETQDVSMEDAGVSIKSGSPADVNNPTVKIEYGEKEASFNITVNDPVKSLNVTTGMSDLDYNQGESFDFSSLILTATRESGATETLTASSTGVTISENTADVNSSNFTQISADGVIPISGTQKIVFTYEGKTVTQTVVVNDTITGVDLISQPTKTVYKRGENLNLAGAVVKLTLGSGTTANINLPDGSVSVSTYSNTTTGTKQNLTVSVAGINATQTIDVEAYNYITGSSLIAPTKSSYEYNEELNLAGGQLKLNWHDGNITTVNLNQNIVSGYSKTTLGTQTINVNYTATYTLSDSSTITDTITDQFDVYVTNPVTSIVITAPTKDTYNHGESLVLTDGTITVNYATGAPKTVAIDASMVTESDGTAVNMSPATSEYASDHTLTKNLKIEYTEDGVTESISYPITIVDNLEEITIQTVPKTSYNVNEQKDISTGAIGIKRASSPTLDVIPMTSDGVSIEGFNTSAEGTVTVTVKYTENGITKEDSYEITVVDTVTDIIVQNAPTDAKYGEELDLNNVTIKVTKGSGTTTENVTSTMISGYDKNTLGVQTITVTYGAKTDTFTIKVKDYVKEITLSPATVAGSYNEELSSVITNNNITYTVVYAKAGAKPAVALAESMVSGYNKETTATQNLTVTYTDNDTESYTNGEDLTANLTVKLGNEITGVTIKAPTKTTYNHGDSLVLTGGEIKLTYSDGTTGTESISSATITESDGVTAPNMTPTASEFNSEQKLSKTLKIEYTSSNGITGSVDYPITIINDVRSIVMHSTNHKVSYNVNDPLDVTNAEIRVIRAVGDVQDVKSITSGMVSGFASNVEVSSLPLTVSYTENGVTKTTTYNIEVKDTVTAIEIQNAPTTAKYGQDINLSGATLKVTKGSGDTTVPATSGVITNYDKNTLGNQTATITYEGKTDTFTVKVLDYVTGITVSPTEATGNYNQELSTVITNNSIKYTVRYAKAGAKTPVALASSMVTGYSKTTIQEQSLTVTYEDTDTNSFTNGEDFTATLKVKLSNIITGVTIKAPTKTTYNHGDSLDLTGGEIKLTYADNTTGTESITSATITEADGTTSPNMSPDASKFVTDNKMTKTLKITYTTANGVTGTANYPITIINDVRSIEMHSTNHKVSYNVNDTLDVTNAEIKVKRAVGTDSIVPVTSTMVSGFASNVEVASLPLTVSYTENGITKTTTYNVEVKDTVTSVVIKTAPKTAYKYNEELDVSGGFITVTRGSGTQDIAITESMVSGYDKTVLGNQTLTITYGGKTATYVVNVKDYVTEITVAPTSATGNYNDELSTVITNNNITYTVTYAKAGAKTPVALASSMVTGYSKTTTGEQNLTVTYEDTDTNSFTNGDNFTATLKVKLSNIITGVTIKAPTKTTYNHGDSLDLAGGEIKLTYANNTTGTESITSATITEADGSTTPNMSPDASKFVTDNKMTKTLKIKYEAANGVTGTANYPITIINDVRSIEMHSTNHKVSYNVNDTLDVTNAEILVTRAVGTPNVVPVTSSMVSGFASNVEANSLPLTVSYTENGITKTTTYNVEVKDTVTSVVIKTAPKTAYKYNEELDVSGGFITVTKGSGTQDIAITASMVSGYDKTVLGNQTITITYGGKTATYVVNVKDYVTGITVAPTSATGNYNDELSTVVTNNNITYTVIYAKAGAKTPVSLASSMVTGYSKTTTEEQSLTVTYEDTDTNSFTNGESFTATLKVTLSDEVSSMVIKEAPKTAYKYNENLDVSTGVITVTRPSGTQDIPMTESMVTGYDKTVLGNQTLTVTYEGKTDSYVVNVKDYVTGITVSPASIPGTINDELSAVIANNNVMYTVTYAKAGAQTPIVLTDSMVTGYNKTLATLQNLTVTYTDRDSDSFTNGDSFTANLAVTLTNAVKSISVTVPTKVAYEHGDTLDLSTGKVAITYADLSTEDKPLTESMVTETATGTSVNMSPAASEYNSNNELTKELKIQYAQGGKTDSKTYNITILNSVDTIAIATSPKTSYNLNESTANVGGTITVTRKAGNTQTVNIEDSMVSGLDTSTEGTNKTATVTFIEGTNQKTTTYTYSVVDPITGISIKDTPNKTTYSYTDTFDITGGVITITKQSGNTEEKSFAEAGVTVTEADGSAVDLKDVTFGADNTATKTIKVSYGGESATFDVKVVNEITQIAIKQTPETSYKIGDSLDLSKGTIEVTRQNGEKEEIALNNSKVTVTGFDSTAENTSLTLTVKYTENGVTKETSYTVSVVDVVTDVQISTTPKTSYKYGEPLDVTTGELTVVRSSGPVTVPMNSNMVTEMDGTPFDPTKLGTRNLKVTYGGIEKTYEVTVSDYVTGVILTPPTKDVYEYGESLDLAGGSLQKVMASGTATTPVALTDASVIVSTFDSTKTGAQTIDVTYEGVTNSFAVRVEDNVQTITIKQAPTKVTYKYGEPLDVTGGLIEATRSSGATEEKAITSSMVTGFNPNQLGEQELTITYEGKTATYDITVEDYATDISITKPTKLIYKIGETIDLTGGLVNVTMASGTSEAPITMSNAEVTVSGFDTTTEGAKTIKVSYKGFTKEFGITVVDPLSGVVLNTLPNKTDYLYGESLDLTGATLDVVKESGASETINVTKEMVSGYNPKKLGNQTIKVTYEGLETEFIVNVEDYVSSLKVTAPDKVEYEYGEELNLAGAEVSIMMASGAVKETVEMTASMVSGFNATKEGKQTISVEYKDLQGSFQVNVVDKVKAISIETQPNKTEYKYGSNLDLTGATIKVVKSSGTYIMDVTDDMVSGYKSRTPGTQVITVTYEGFTTNFIVIVGNKPVTPVRPSTPVTPEEPEEPTTPEEPGEPTTPEVPQEPIIPEEPEQPEEKPTGTLGVKDEKDNNDNTKVIAGIIAGIGLFILFILIFVRRKNAKIYVVEEDSDEFVLGGIDHINSKNPKLDVDKYLDDETYDNMVKIQLNDSISEKLDGRVLEIKHRGGIIEYKIKYEDVPCEIILDAIKK